MKTYELKKPKHVGLFLYGWLLARGIKPDLKKTPIWKLSFNDQEIFISRKTWNGDQLVIVLVSAGVTVYRFPLDKYQDVSAITDVIEELDFVDEVCYA